MAFTAIPTTPLGAVRKGLRNAALVFTPPALWMVSQWYLPDLIRATVAP